MRKNILYIAVAIATFISGVTAGSLSGLLVTETDDLGGISEPLHLELFEARTVCEIHASVISKEMVHADEGYSTPEAYLLNSHLVGGSNLWPFWRAHAAAVKSEFPHGYKRAYRKCVPHETGCKEIEVCPTCRAAELMWVNKAIREKL